MVLLEEECDSILVYLQNGTYPTTNVINIYDSMFRSCSPHIQQQIACIMNTKYSHIQANFVNVNHQNGSSDCGVFAVAFAVSLCYGLQPAKFCYNQNNMRSHLIQFIAWKEVEWNFSPLDRKFRYFSFSKYQSILCMPNS